MRLLKPQLATLPRRFTSAFEKRREENLVKFNLKPEEAVQEALQHVGRLVYLWQCKEAAKKAQLPLYAPAKPSSKRGLADVD